MQSDTKNHQPEALYAQTPHSVRFDELEVVLPGCLTQPLLKNLVRKLQNQMLEALMKTPANPTKSNAMTSSNAMTTTHAINNSKLSSNKQAGIAALANTKKTSAKTKNEISTAHTILTHLVTTEIADAAVLVAITNEPRPRLLLTRRASHLNTHAGEVSFAGGKYETADGNNMVTALREACEETALPPSRVKIVGQLPLQTAKSGMSVRPIVALVEPDVKYVPELGEIKRIFWADLEALIDQPTIEYNFVYPQGEQLINFTTPSWIIDNETVWGLTGRIIASLLDIGFDRKTPWYFRPMP